MLTAGSCWSVLANKWNKINYQLNNIVSNGETHVEILRNDPKEIEILEDIPYLWKIGCKGLVGPAKFIVRHKTKGKVKSHVSLEKSIGANIKAGKKITVSDKTRFQVFPEDNEKTFENDFIYWMLTSITGCKIELIVDFPNEDDRRRRK